MDWDIAITPVHDINHRRHRDWCVCDYPGIGFSALPFHYAQSKYQFINGSYFCVKTRFLRQNPLDQSLFWGEGEDVAWSRKIRAFAKIILNKDTYVKYSKQKNDDDIDFMTRIWNPNSEKLAAEVPFDKTGNYLL
jgi:hypothetical protein